MREYRKMPAEYVSMIKLGGIPILPPLMTEKVREECAKLRELAVSRSEARKRKVAGTANGQKVEVTLIETVSESASVKEPPERESTFLTESADTSSVDKRPESTTLPSTSSTLIRSESFTLETPSAALADGLARLDEPPSPVKTDLSLSGHVTALSASPVISDKLTRILHTQSGQVLAPMDLDATAQQLQQMKQLLNDYHKLQREELKLRQEEEIKRLAEQQSSVEHLAKLASPVEERHEEEENVGSEAWDVLSSLATVTPLPPDQNDVIDDMALIRKSPLAAVVRAHLVRRLFHSERVCWLRKTAKDLSAEIEIEHQRKTDISGFSAADEFTARLQSQLFTVRTEIHDIFFNYSYTEQRYLRCVKPKIYVTKPTSLATRKSLARKSDVVNFGGNQKENVTSRKAVKSPYKLTVAKTNCAHRRSGVSAAVNHLVSPRRSHNKHPQTPLVVGQKTSKSTPVQRTFRLQRHNQPSKRHLSSAKKIDSKVSEDVDQLLKRPWR